MRKDEINVQGNLLKIFLFKKFNKCKIPKSVIIPNPDFIDKKIIAIIIFTTIKQPSTQVNFIGL